MKHGFWGSKLLPIAGIFLCLFGAHLAHATTYYVDNVGGSNSNNGTSSSTPWQTIAKVNSSTFNPGDSILFKDGDTWREQLNVPSSGATGTPITFGSYGSGAQPIIDGANTLTGWVLQPSGVLTSDASTSALYDFNNNLNDSGSNGYNLTAGGAVSYTTGQYFPYALASTSYAHASTSTIFNFGTGSFTIEAWVQLTPGTTASGALFTKGVAGLTRYEFDIVRNGNSSYFQAFYYDGSHNPVVTYSPGNANLFNGGWHLIAMRVDLANQVDDNLSLWIDGTEEGTTTLSGVGSANNAYNFTVGARSDGSYQNPFVVGQVRVSNFARTSFSTSAGYQPNTWAVSSTQPNIVLLNRTAAVQESSSTTLNSPGEWYWSSNNLYLNATSSPSTVYLSPGVEVPARNFGIDTNGKSYITIQGLTILGANYHGVAFTGSDSNVSIQNNTLTLNGDGGIEAEDLVAATNVSIASNTISWNGGNGVLGMKDVHDWTVQDNNVTHNCQNAGISIATGTQNPYDWQYCGGIRFWEYWTDNSSTIYNIVVQNNSVSYNGQLADDTWLNDGTTVGGVGIWFDVIDDPLGGNIIRYNNVFENLFGQIQMEHDQHVQTYGNLVHDSAPAFTVGIFVTDSIHGGDRFSGYNSIYNNTVYNNTSYGIRNEGAQTPTASTSIDNVFSNNISVDNALNNLMAATGGNNDGTDGYGNVYTYNDFGSQASNFIMWGFGTYDSTYSSWETASGNCGTVGCSHSVSSDPLFISPSTNDFALQSSSPAIDAGLSLGSTYEYGLDPASTWPSNIILDNENSYGSGWDIGAYVYTQTSTPSVSFISPSSGSTISGSVTLSASSTAVAPASISSLQFYLDGSPLGSPVTTTSSLNTYSYTWDTTQTSNTSHTLYALATDNYGNTASSSPITLGVSNAAPPPGVVVDVAAGYAPSAFITSLVSSTTESQAPSTVATSTTASTTLSTSSLETELDSLLAELQSLEAQAGGTTSPNISSSYVFTRNLSLWSTGSDVTALQTYLIDQDKGPAAQKLKAHGTTTTFGILTYNALVEFQESVGIVPASGYFGPVTRAYTEAHS